MPDKSMLLPISGYVPPHHTPGKSDAPAHTPGTPRGEEHVKNRGREPGRDDPLHVRTARDSTSVNPKGAAPISPLMPQMPPA